MPYIPGDTNIIQTILEDNYTDFDKIYDEVYAKDYGIFRLERISELVLKSIDCGDWNQGIARIIWLDIRIQKILIKRCFF